jgi:hypothetical protein
MIPLRPVVAPLAVVLTFLAGAAPAPAPEAVSLPARPFPLSQVRLLESPFHAAMLRDQRYLLDLDPDRLLHTFRVNAGLPSSARPLGGWEAPEVELRGHSLGHFLTAHALMYAATGDARFKARAEAVVAELARVQAALAGRFNPGYLSAFPEELFDRVEKRQRVWAPYYTIHKIMAGLLDVHQLCGNAQALEVLVKQAAWVKLRTDRLSEEQRRPAWRPSSAAWARCWPTCTRSRAMRSTWPWPGASTTGRSWTRWPAARTSWTASTPTPRSPRPSPPPAPTS